MIRLSAFAIAVLSLLTGGCGSMPMLIVNRLDDEQQKRVDTMWEAMLTPSDRLDRQDLLDALIATTAWQSGMDKVWYRSEKRWSGGLVTMEVRFDRTKPADEIFEVVVLGPDAKVLRRERYDRPGIEATDRDQFAPIQNDAKDAAELIRVRNVRMDKIRKEAPDRFP